MTQINKIIGAEAGINFPYDKAVPGQGQRHFIGIAILHAPDSHGHAAKAGADGIYSLAGLFQPWLIIDGRAERAGKGHILPVNLRYLIQSRQGNRWNAQSFFHILCRQPGLGIKDEVEIGLGHSQVFIKVPATG